MSIRLLFQLSFLLLISTVIRGQVVSTVPALPTDADQVVITFDATKGDAGLKGYTGNVYAHIGVITDKSTSDSDWKYVKAAWNVNLPECKMTRTATDLYTLTLSPEIRSYFAVPIDEKILKIALVFRSQDGTKTGKDTGGKDIYATVYTATLSVDITSPNGGYYLHNKNLELTIEASAMLNESIGLFEDGVLIDSKMGQSISFTYQPTVGKHVIVAEAIDASSNSVKDSVIVVVDDLISPSVALPAGLKNGVNYIDDNTVTVVLWAPYKQVVYLTGDFNDWQPDASYKMNKGLGADTATYWITINGLTKGEEYGYQFLIDNKIKIADPYTNKILDPWDDKWIPDVVYPNLKEYPDGKTSDRVSVLQTGQQAYTWQVTDFQTPDQTNLVIYELLIRDFQNSLIDGNNQLGYLQQVIDSINYFKRLGVNAIEIMPFNEFEGNNSWGYNPNFYFAPDKAYGTPEKYKEFIDLCHQNGIAVIMDMVLNHAFNSCTFAKMYWDDAKNRPAANNPWFNAVAPHTCFGWGCDFNHESPYTQALVDSISSFWMKEYKVDGFRFDFTKGFTNTKTTTSNNCNGSYDASRIAILKRMYDEIKKRKSDAIVILENWGDAQEDRALADYGMMTWTNQTSQYAEATMGYNTGSKSDLTYSSYKARGFKYPHAVAYMESHDEERNMYKNKTWGAQVDGYDARTIEVSSRRGVSAAAMLLAVPGPKMIWMFGERGYDVSIDSIDRVAPKPPKWEYMQNPDRDYMYDMYGKLIKLRLQEPVFATTDFTQSVVTAVKQISLNMSGSDVRIVANFDTKPMTVTPNFSTTGYWYNHFKGDSIKVKDVNMSITLAPGDFRLFSQKKLAGFAYNTAIGDEGGSLEEEILKVYPVPFNETLNVVASASVASVELITLSGQTVVYAVAEGESIVLQTAQLPKGVYVVHVTLQNGDVLLRQIVK